MQRAERKASMKCCSYAVLLCCGLMRSLGPSEIGFAFHGINLLSPPWLEVGGAFHLRSAALEAITN